MLRAKNALAMTEVMDCGRIFERGISAAILWTHDELLAQSGLYSQLYETQFNREKI
jgi:ABC-type multidrug transport system fused ATPase/permease subunit